MEVELLRMWVGGEVFERNIVRGNEIGHVVSRKGRTRARRVGAGAGAGAGAGSSSSSSPLHGLSSSRSDSGD